MFRRSFITLAAGFSALLGLMTAGFATDNTAPVAVPNTSASVPETTGEAELAQQGPASILIEMTYSNLHRINQFAGGEHRFAVPVYFARESAEPSEDAKLLLAAVADEAAAYAGVAITIRPLKGSESGLNAARAMAVFDQLNAFGVPARTMALELEQGPGAYLTSHSSTI